MSVKQMALVWEHDFGHAEQSIMLALADHAHDDGTQIRPSVARLAWKTGYEDRQVQRILKKLRDEMKILVCTERGGGRGKPNVYRFDWTKGVKKSPFRPKRVTSEAEKGDTAMTPEPSSLEPSYSRRDADASINILKNPFGYYCKVADALEVEILPEDREQTSKHFKDLMRLHSPTKEELRRVVSKMLEARTAGVFWSPQKTLEKVRGNNVTQLRPNQEPPRPRKRVIS
jgi:hypothetical protein